MFEYILVALTGILTIIIVRQASSREIDELSPKMAERVQRLWRVAQEATNQKKYLPAEKALLTILKLDHKNAAAYNRLGILYAKQQNYEDAIECFQIASSIEPKASSLHNLGLIFYETGDYEKAAIAFTQALEKEPIAARYIAYAKVQQKTNDQKGVVHSLENAVRLEPNPQTLSLLIDAYEAVGDEAAALRVRRRLQRHTARSGPKKRVQQPRRVS